MSEMFFKTPFNQPLNNWNVSSVTDMGRMFSSTDFNQPVGDWDVSSVTDMSWMFNITPFNQDISNWCVPNIFSEPDGFSISTPLLSEYKPLWGTCPGTPPKITQHLPQNNSTDVLRNVELVWKSDSLSTYYQLQVFEGFNPTVIDTLVSDTTYAHIYPFKDNFVYNWRVRGINKNRSIEGEFLTGDWSPVWKFTTILDTSVESDELTSVYTLDQNYLNPFNPTTQIRFALPESGDVKLDVYDMTGRLVRTLVNESLVAGYHEVAFDASQLSSGVYTYNLKTGNTNISRKLDLVK